MERVALMGFLLLLPLPPLPTLPPKGAEFVRRAFSFSEDLLALADDEFVVTEDLATLGLTVAEFEVNRFSGEAGGVS